MIKHALRIFMATLVVAGIVPPASASLVINWKLDESSGTTAFDSATSAGGAQNGTSGNAAPQWLPTGGILGGALQLSATAQSDVDEAVSHTAASAIITAYPVTISTWVKTTSTAAYRESFAYFGNQATSSEYLQTSRDSSTSKAAAMTRSATTMAIATGGNVVNDDNWHHVVGVYSSATSRAVYVDGKLAGTNATSVALPSLTRFSIGALMRSAPTDSFKGLIDDVGVWDEALSVRQIALLNGLARFSGVTLDDPAVAAVEAVYVAQSGQATAGTQQWQYATGLPSTTIGVTGTAGDLAYIVLDSSGNGVSAAVPEPGLGSLLVGTLAALALRRRRA